MGHGLKIKVETFSNDMACECGDGLMRPVGAALLTSPPKYPHACTKCGRRETFLQTYPYITHEGA